MEFKDVVLNINEYFLQLEYFFTSLLICHMFSCVFLFLDILMLLTMGTRAI